MIPIVEDSPSGSYASPIGSVARPTVALFALVVDAAGIVRQIHRHTHLAEFPFVPAVGEAVHARVAPPLLAVLENNLARARRGESFVTRFSSTDHDKRYFEAFYFPTATSRGDEAHGPLIPRDGSIAILVSETSGRRERELERELLRSALDAAEDGVMICDASGDVPIQYVNAAFLRVTGYALDEVLGRNPRFLVDRDEPCEAEREVIRNALQQGTPARVTLKNRRRDGTPFENELRISPVRDSRGRTTHWVGVMRDVTRERRLTEQVRRAGTLEALARLASGAAHDFNNLLATMAMEIAFLRGTVAAPDATESVEALADATHRASALVARLVSLARPSSPSPQPVDLEAFLREIEPRLRRVVDGCELTLTSDGAIGAKIDPQQLENALVNLVLNAADASAKHIHLDLSAERDAVVLEVTDDGAGMEPSTRQRAFEPFFSTKGTRGTGLGLTSVQTTIEAIGGRIVLLSRRGRGTTFELHFPTVELPRFSPVTSTSLTPDLPTESSSSPPLRVLLVEDQAALRRALTRALRHAGWSVSVADDGLEALRVLEATPVDLLVTDVLMPHVDGLELTRRALASTSRLPVLLMSGYPDRDLGRIPDDPRVDFLAKPFQTRMLLERARALVARVADQDAPTMST